MDEDHGGIEDYIWAPRYLALVRAAKEYKGRFPVHRIGASIAGPGALAFTPDCRYLATGGSNGVSLIDFLSGKRMRQLSWDGRLHGGVNSDVKDSQRVIRSVAFTLDGRALIAGDRKGNIYVWDMATGSLRWYKDGTKKGEGHGDTGWPLSGAVVAASPEGSLVASSGGDGFVRGWDVMTGEMRGEVELATAGRPYVPWRGAPTFTYPYDRGRCSIYDVHNVRSWFGVHSLAFSPDGRWIACGMGEFDDVVDPILAVDTREWTAMNVAEFPVRRVPDYARDDRRTHEMAFKTTCQIGFSADGRWLVTCGGEGARAYEVVVKMVCEGNRERERLRLAGGGIIGYDLRKELEEGWDAKKGGTGGAQGATFLGKTGIVAILHEGGLVEGIHIEDVAHACGGRLGRLEKPINPGGTVQLATNEIVESVVPLFVAASNPDDFNMGLDGSIAASADGRWLCVGSEHRGCIIIDLALSYTR